MSTSSQSEQIRHSTPSETWEAIYASGRAQRYWPAEEVIRFAARCLKPHDRVFDVGCGNGSNLAILAGERRNVVGFDISKTAVARAKLEAIRLKQSEPLCGVIDIWHEWNVNYDEFKNFDALIDCRVSQHVEWSQHEAMYREYYKVLKPGGHFFLLHLDDDTEDASLPQNERLRDSSQSYTWWNIERGVYKNNGLVCMPPYQELMRCVQNAGFVIPRIEKALRGSVEIAETPTACHYSSHAMIEAYRPV